MKLLIVISDADQAYCEYTNTGHLPIIKRRSTVIELTPIQLSSINLQKGEDIESISPELCTEN